MKRNKKEQTFWIIKSPSGIIFPFTTYWDRDGAIRACLKFFCRGYKTSAIGELFRDLIGAEWMYTLLQKKRKEHYEIEWKGFERQGFKVVEIKIIEV
jgi:hypothetical protein